MKVLDLFCGLGGWSRPFVEDGDYVIGIDIVDYKDQYCGKFLQADIRNISGKDFRNYDLIIGSPPCNEFSIAKEMWKGTKNERNVEKGLELIYEFERIVREADPEIWLMENVKNLLKWYNREPIWYFRISRRGYRCLWGNIKIIKEFDNSFADERDIWRTYGWDTRPYRAKIPYEIARFIADLVKETLKEIRG
jgi:site-specific DNA-cytosine methylase